MISLKGIERNFQVGDQTVHALSNVNLEIAAGEYVSIMGPSGSGKSTLLNIVGLLDRPSKGIYKLDGGDVTGLNDEQEAGVRRDKIGFVFQSFHLVPRLSALENVALPMLLAGIGINERRKRASENLEAYGLADRMHHRPDQLSGGQRQRVAMARATIMRPVVLLADEPTGNLDRASGKDVVALLEGLNESGVTLVVVTHDPQLGQRARRKIHMVDGKIDTNEIIAQ